MDVYAPRKLLGCSQSCRKKYLQHIRMLSEFLGRPATVDDLTEDHIAALMQRRIDQKKSPATVNDLRDQFMALAKFAALRGHLASAPDVKGVKKYTRTPTAWTREQVAAIFAACDRQEGYIAGIVARRWWHALHAVMWDCGGRIGAIMAAGPDQVDESRGVLRLNAEHQKQKADQTFLLHPDTMKALDAISYRSRDLIFPWDRNRSMLWHRYKKILASAGLPYGRRDMFHRMRRTVASWFEAAGGDATKLLGHSNRKVTEAYLDPTIVPRKHASDVLFRPNGNPQNGSQPLANGPKEGNNAQGPTGGQGHARKDDGRTDPGRAG